MRGVRQQRFNGCSKLDRIAVRHQVTRNAVLDDFRCAAMGASDDGFAARHRLQIHQAESFALAGQSENFAGGVARGKFRVAHSGQKMHVAVHAVFFHEILQPGAVIACSRQDQLQLRPARQQPRQRGNQGVHALVSFRRQPASHCQDHASRRKIRWQRGMRTGADQRFELRIERPGQNANPFARDSLLRCQVVGGIPAGCQNQVCVAQCMPAQPPERLPDVNPMRADNALHSGRHKPHRLYHGCQIRVRGKNEFCFAPGCLQGRHRESTLGAVAPREHKFLPSQGHAVQLRRIIQAEKAAIHAAAGGEFREHGRQVAAGPLHPAGCVQLGKEANEHAQSLPSTANDGKSGCIAASRTRTSRRVRFF